MKKYIYTLGFFCVILLAILGSCKATKEPLTISDNEKEVFNQQKGDTIRIANDETEYEIIIIEPGFNMWLQSMARPKGFYSQSYLENRNRFWVIEWNQRVMQPMRYNSNIYELQIEFSPYIDYGYEVNYKLYNYFIYFQRKYNQRLGGFTPRL